MNYTEFVASLAKPGKDIIEDIRFLLPEVACKMLAIVGLVGELSELQEANTNDHIKEELHDSGFYLRAFWLALGSPDEQLWREEMEDRSCTSNGGPQELSKAAHRCLELIKKEFFHNKVCSQELYKEYVYQYGVMHVAYARTAKLYGYKVEELEAANVEKLTARHPKGYSNASQNARADKAGQEDDVSADVTALANDDVVEMVEHWQAADLRDLIGGLEGPAPLQMAVPKDDALRVGKSKRK